MIREVMDNLGSLGSLSSDVVLHIENLIDAHIQLSKAELQENKRRAITTVVLLTGGSIALIVGLFAASMAAVQYFVQLSLISMADGLLILGSVWILGALLALWTASRLVADTLLVPSQSLASLKENILWILRAN